jgi:cell division protein FtsQ
MKVRAATEKNFRRARSKPGRKRRLTAMFSWRALRVALTLAVMAYAGYRAFDLAFNAGVLRVRQIRVQGNDRLSSGEVRQRISELEGANILTANIDRYRRKLLESAWVSDVALRRVLPSTVEVYVSERRPFGLCRFGSQLYLIDRHGKLMDEFGPQYAEFDLPLVDGLVRAPRRGKPTIDENRAELAARVVDAIQDDHALMTRVSEIDVSDAHDAVILLDDDPALLHVGEEKFRERLQSYLEIAEALRDRIPDIDYVDLRFAERLYVKPRGRAGSTALSLATAGKSF